MGGSHLEEQQQPGEEGLKEEKAAREREQGMAMLWRKVFLVLRAGGF